MKNNKLKMLINLIVICLCLFFVFSTNVQANSINDWVTEGNNFITKGQKNNPISTNDIKNAVVPIAQALVAIATVVLVVITVIMGIKYMMCGNADEKAKLKIQLIGLVVSTIVVFGAQAIWALLYNFMIGVTK